MRYLIVELFICWYCNYVQSFTMYGVNNMERYNAVSIGKYLTTFRSTLVTTILQNVRKYSIAGTT